MAQKRIGRNRRVGRPQKSSSRSAKQRRKQDATTDAPDENEMKEAGGRRPPAEGEEEAPEGDGAITPRDEHWQGEFGAMA